MFKVLWRICINLKWFMAFEFCFFCFRTWTTSRRRSVFSAGSTKSANRSWENTMRRRVSVRVEVAIWTRSRKISCKMKLCFSLILYYFILCQMFFFGKLVRASVDFWRLSSCYALGVLLEMRGADADEVEELLRRALEGWNLQDMQSSAKCQKKKIWKKSTRIRDSKKRFHLERFFFCNSTRKKLSNCQAERSKWVLYTKRSWRSSVVWPTSWRTLVKSLRRSSEAAKQSQKQKKQHWQHGFLFSLTEFSDVFIGVQSGFVWFVQTSDTINKVVLMFSNNLFLPCEGTGCYKS